MTPWGISLPTTPSLTRTVKHNVLGLTVKHQVDSGKGGVTKERCCQATEEAPAPLAVIDAPQGGVDALVAVPPALRRKRGAHGCLVALRLRTALPSAGCRAGALGALVPTRLARLHRWVLRPH